MTKDAIAPQVGLGRLSRDRGRDGDEAPSQIARGINILPEKSGGWGVISTRADAQVPLAARLAAYGACPQAASFAM